MQAPGSGDGLPGWHWGRPLRSRMVLGRGLQHPTSGAGVPPRCCPVAGAGVLQSTGLLGSWWGGRGPGTLWVGDTLFWEARCSAAFPAQR